MDRGRATGGSRIRRVSRDHTEGPSRRNFHIQCLVVPMSNVGRCLRAAERVSLRAVAYTN